jgi:hypothetical protein
MPEEIDVLETTHLLIKVNTLNKLSPARVTITYGPGQVVPKKESKEDRKLSQNERFNKQLKNMLNLNPKRRPETTVDLKVFYSREEEEPNESNFDKVRGDRIIHNPGKVIILTNDGKEKFDTDHVYMSLYSLTGCFVTLTLHMKEEHHHHLGHFRNEKV